MHDLHTLYSSLSAEWASAMFRAAIQGALAIAVAAGVIRIAPRIAPRWRCWLMRLAYARMLLALVFGAAVILPLLPRAASPAIPMPASPVRPLAPTRPLVPARPIEAVRPMRALPVAANMHPLRHASGALDEGGSLAELVAPAPPHAQDRATPPPAAVPADHPAITKWLLVIWFCGALLSAGLLWREAVHAAELRRHAAPIESAETVTAFASLCARYGIRRPPLLLRSHAVDAPMLSGWRRSAILLPEGLIASCSALDVELILAHELAHVRRRDLLWAVLPAIGRCLFYFHPLVWLAEHEWREAVETACDRDVLALGLASPARYAASIVKVVQLRNHRRPAFMVAQMAESYSHVKRRLEVMHNHRLGARSRPLLYGVLIGAAVLATGTPWEVSAQQPVPAAPAVTSAPAGLPALAAAAGGTRGARQQPPRADASPALDAHAKTARSGTVMAQPPSAVLPASSTRAVATAQPNPEAQGASALPAAVSRFQNPVLPAPSVPATPAAGTAAPSLPTMPAAGTADPTRPHAVPTPGAPLTIQDPAKPSQGNPEPPPPLDPAAQRQLSDAITRAVSAALQSLKTSGEGVDRPELSRQITDEIAAAMKSVAASHPSPEMLAAMKQQLHAMLGPNGSLATTYAPAMAAAARQMAAAAQTTRPQSASGQPQLGGAIELPTTVTADAARQLAEAATALAARVAQRTVIAVRAPNAAIGNDAQSLRAERQGMVMAKRKMAAAAAAIDHQARVMAQTEDSMRAPQSAALMHQLSVTLAQLRVLMAQLSKLYHQDAARSRTHADLRPAHRAQHRVDPVPPGR